MAAVSTERRGLALLAVGVALGLMAAWTITRSIRQPLQELGEALELLASGQLDQVIPHTDKRNEIGSTAKSVAIMQQGAMALRDERWVKQGSQISSMHCNQSRLKSNLRRSCSARFHPCSVSGRCFHLNRQGTFDA
ncbi:MAG: methyl-accepting chemotaxis protein [Betaproteobacteria bacterium]|nr:methyl-accepting chemotaxis protein [Betaproteobacteria bacterium]